MLRCLFVLFANVSYDFQDYIDGSSSARLDPHAAPALDDEMGKSVAVDLVRLLPASAKEGKQL